MNALGDYIQAQLDERGWRQVDLVRASGLTKQVVSKLLRPDVELRRMIEPATITGLAAAFDKDELEIQLKAAEATGLAVEDAVPIIRTAHDESDETLLEILLLRERRRKVRSGHQSAPAAAPKTEQVGNDAGQGGGVMVSGGTSGDLRDPRRTHGSGETLDEQQSVHAHPHLL